MNAGAGHKREPAPPSSLELKLTWKSGDEIGFSLPKRLRTEPLPDNANRMALLHGPIVLAADFGVAARGRGRRGPTTAPSDPILTANHSSVDQWLTPVVDKPGQFRAATSAGKPDITYRPFYQLSDHRYGIYCDVYTQAEWDARKPPATEPAVQTN